jgi:hypothetical protein
MQFTRYMKGEAFPRPDILVRICTYFDTDANILIRPLPQKEDKPSAEVLDLSFQHLLRHLPPREYSLPEGQLASGLYKVWRRSYFYPDRVFCASGRIWRDSGVTHWKTYEPTSSNCLDLDALGAPPERRVGQLLRMRPSRGFAYNVNNSVCVFANCPKKTPIMRVITLYPGFAGMPSIYSGRITLVRGSAEGTITSVPVVIEPMRLDFRGLRRHSEGKFFFSAEELPRRLASFMFPNEG